ncbi:uncharacterized protein LOC115740335 [Rhodamnia argentea]|uniref:Uncharacterized protein LOC115740335 n=1 Tax=Rhodamnia argentea TaxID=178133 RepID=A0A8B8P4D3_9MYRT|nr:uncharacterized protein LOC115740335 [Rhodamnia argentea]XP_030529682.1 uncharacterized protein LOC115740335 [Rhodamnia argentea]
MSAEENDSDAPEELTAEQAFHRDEEIRKIQEDNKARVTREGKARRRLWAQRKTPRPSKRPIDGQEITENGTEEDGNESLERRGMLPNEIVTLLAAREKQVFLSDSEDERAESKPISQKKKVKRSGSGPIILKEIPPPQCIQSSLEFLKKRKMQVSRSSSILNNPNQALRFLSNSGVLSKK